MASTDIQVTAESKPFEMSWPLWLRLYGPVVIAYVLVTWFTDAYSMGDTRIYVTQILEGSGYAFWDFGHILWRPLGWALYKISLPITQRIFDGDSRLEVTGTLMAVAWLSGLASVLLIHALARKFCRGQWIAYLVTAAFLFSNAFLNYSQTGHSYIPGLALLLLALYQLLRDEAASTSVKTSLVAGTALALAVCMWLPYVLSVPAIVAAPLVLGSFNRQQFRQALQTCVVFGVVMILVYAIGAIRLGVNSFAEFQNWLVSSAHGIDGMKGIPRMVFGIARSVINMGNDGKIFKRYVLKDPLNPVSLFDLFRLSFWKLALFYLFLAAVLLNLLFSRLGRRGLALLILSAAPLIFFALYLFEAGTIDRYLPLYPVLFLAIAISLGNDRLKFIPRYVAAAFVIALVVSNGYALSTFVLNREQDAVARRFGDLKSLLQPDKNRVITVGQEDPAYALNVNFPFNPLNRSGLSTDMMADRGNEQVLRWRSIFATKTLALWEKGGDVWVTKRIFHERPRAEWEWVEGDDPRVTWNDLHSFFSQLEFGTSVGDEDGFMLLLNSPANKQFLRGYTSEK